VHGGGVDEFELRQVDDQVAGGLGRSLRQASRSVSRVFMSDSPAKVTRLYAPSALTDTFS
jgi:hypothetical protein